MITVIIPTYKPGAYLWKCLDSLESQTIEKSLYEVIVILNGCREPYATNIAQGIGKYSMNVRIEQTDTPGVSNARNIGIDMAKGDYICFIDDDDWVSDTYLQSLYNSAIESGCMAVSNVEAIEDGSGITRPDYLSDVYQALSHKKTAQFFRFFTPVILGLVPRIFWQQTPNQVHKLAILLHKEYAYTRLSGQAR